MSQWYFDKDGEEVGPVSAKQLVGLAGKGALQLDTSVRREDMSESLPAQEVKELKAAIASKQGQDQSPDPTPADTNKVSTHSKKSTVVSIALSFSLALPFIVLLVALLWARAHTDKPLMAVVAIACGLLSVIPSLVITKIGLAATVTRRKLTAALMACGITALVAVGLLMMSPAVPDLLVGLLACVYLVLVGQLLIRILKPDHPYGLGAFSRVVLVLIPMLLAVSIFALPAGKVNQIADYVGMPDALWGPGADGSVPLQGPATVQGNSDNPRVVPLSEKEKATARSVIEDGTRLLNEAQSQNYGTKESPSLRSLSSCLSILQLVNGATGEALLQTAVDAYGERPSVEMLGYEAEYWASAAWCVNSMSDRTLKKQVSTAIWSRLPNLSLIQSREMRQLVAARFGQAAMWLGDDDRLDELIQEVNGANGEILRADMPYGREFVKALLLSGNNDRIQPWVDAQPVSTSLILIQRGDVKAASEIITGHPMDDRMRVWLLMQCAFDVACRGTESPNPYIDELRRMIGEMDDQESAVRTALGLELDVFMAVEQESFGDASNAASKIDSEAGPSGQRRVVRNIQRDTLVVTALCAMRGERTGDARLLLDQLPVQDGAFPISLLREAIKQGMDPVEVIGQVTGVEIERVRGEDFNQVIELLSISGLDLKKHGWVAERSDLNQPGWNSMEYDDLTPETFWALSKEDLVATEFWASPLATYFSGREEGVSFLAAALIGRSRIPLNPYYLDFDTNMTAFPPDDLPEEKPNEASAVSN